jgi:hypothetical protein
MGESMSIEQAAREYIRLRRLRISLRNHRNDLHSECAWLEGYCDPSACCALTMDEEDWCELCRESDVAHEWYRMAAQQQGVALRRLEREVNK